MPVTASGTITDTGCTIKTAAYAVKDEYGEVQPSGPVTLGVDGKCGHLLGRYLWHQFGDTTRDLDSILIKLILPEQAGERRAPQLQFGRDVTRRCSLVGARSKVEIECV